MVVLVQLEVLENKENMDLARIVLLPELLLDIRVEETIHSSHARFDKVYIVQFEFSRTNTRCYEFI